MIMRGRTPTNRPTSRAFRHFGSLFHGPPTPSALVSMPARRGENKSGCYGTPYWKGQGNPWPYSARSGLPMPAVCCRWACMYSAAIVYIWVDGTLVLVLHDKTCLRPGVELIRGTSPPCNHMPTRVVSCKRRALCPQPTDQHTMSTRTQRERTYQTRTVPMNLSLERGPSRHSMGLHKR